jgi:hypothetical protein
VIIGNGHGDQTASVTQGTGVEYATDLTDNSVSLQLRDQGQHILLREGKPFRQGLVRLRRQGKGALYPIEQHPADGIQYLELPHTEWIDSGFAFSANPHALPGTMNHEIPPNPPLEKGGRGDFHLICLLTELMRQCTLPICSANVNRVVGGDNRAE